MESEKENNESTEAPSGKELTPTTEFDKLTSSNEKAAKLAKEHQHKFKQLTVRYEELRGRMKLKIIAAQNIMKELQGNIYDVSHMKEVMKLLKLEFTNTEKDYNE